MVICSGQPQETDGAALPLCHLCHGRPNCAERAAFPFGSDVIVHGGTGNVAGERRMAPTDVEETEVVLSPTAL